MFFLIFSKEMQYFLRKCPRHIPFIVHYHLKLSNIHHILIKFWKIAMYKINK